MNREQRRYLKKQGQIDAEGNAVVTKRDNAPVKKERVAPKQYASEVGAELGRVTWPTRGEVIKYTIVVVMTLLIITALVAALDFAFAEGLIALLNLPIDASAEADATVGGAAEGGATASSTATTAAADGATSASTSTGN